MEYTILRTKTQQYILSHSKELKTYRAKTSEEMQSTKFGDMPRATAEPPIVYSRINAQPINQATLQEIMTT